MPKLRANIGEKLRIAMEPDRMLIRARCREDSLHQLQCLLKKRSNRLSVRGEFLAAANNEVVRIKDIISFSIAIVFTCENRFDHPFVCCY